MLSLWVFLVFASSAAASFSNNLNYRSPSHNHPSLGISIHKVNKRNNPSKAFNASQLNFTHGVASGDPLPNSVILWTRVAPMFDNVNDNRTVSGVVPLYNPVPIYNSNGSHTAVSQAPVCVQYKIGSDQALQNVLDSGTLYTSSDIDYTVKVEAQNLSPFTQYYYQFNVCGSSNVTSPLGRTKTTPSADDSSVNEVGIAVYSCSNYPFGYFNAFGNPAIKDSVDYVVHLGDVIYEYKEGDYGWGWSIDRIPLPDNTIFTLYDYRKRHATYRTDAGMLESMAKLPWCSVWDDHEIADNTYRDGSSELNNTEASFVMDGGVSVDQRKMNAVRAYFEWMPLRQVEMDDNLRIWRSFQIGNLADLILLDTRQYDRSITDLYWNTDYVYQISHDAGRSMMGSRQESWFYNQLISSKQRNATWRVIGSQTVFSRLNESIAYGQEEPFDVDAWDGYTSNRNRTFQTLYDNNIGNNIILSGDSHANWVSDLTWLDQHPYDPISGHGSIGVEFAGTAVSSPSPGGQNITIAAANAGSQALIAANRELQWSELYYRGYYELHITRDNVKAQYFGMPTIVTQNAYEISLANFTVQNGANKLQRDPSVGGGTVENGALKGGKTVGTNLTHNVMNGTYFISNFTQEDT